MTSPSATWAAIVLCGGASKRMGRPKAWLPFGGETLLCRTVNTLRNMGAMVFVVAGPEQDLPALPANVVVARDPVPTQGPLQGIAVGLRHAEGEAQRAFVCPTDAPFLTTELVRAMQRFGATNDIAIVEDEGFLHPLCATYATRLHREAQRMLDEGERRPRALVERAKTRIVTRDDLLADAALAARDPNLDGLSNLNTPEAYDRALERLKASR